MKTYYSALYLTVFLCTYIHARSIYRPVDPLVPEVNIHWVDDSKTYTLKKYHLEEYPIFKLFDKAFFEEHLLPCQPISFRYDPTKSVKREELAVLIEELIQEIKDAKKSFAHFTVLQSKDFNFKTGRGLLIVKFTDYPFVVKLFVETPDSIVSPFGKGMEPIFFFFMGGIDRHRLGFTRIKNREIIKQRLMESPLWAQKVDIPRKWHWVPQGTRWIEITGQNIGSKKKQSISFPGTYCIIADAIEAEKNLSLLSTHDKKLALDLCNYLDIWIDPHMKNFMIEKGTGKLVIVDTEHFPTSVGLREKIHFDSYSNWYLYLAGKCWRNAFMQTKNERRNPKKPLPEMSLNDYHNLYRENKNETFLLAGSHSTTHT